MPPYEEEGALLKRVVAGVIEILQELGYEPDKDGGWPVVAHIRDLADQAKRAHGELPAEEPSE